jgi:hypothetical protein
MVDVPADQIGQGSGSQSTVRQIGSALGIAVLGTLLFTGTQASLESKLTDTGIAADQQTLIVDAVVDSAGSAIPVLSESLTAQRVPVEIADSVQTAAGDAFTDGAKLAAWAAAGFLLLGFASTFNLGSRKPEKAKV